MRRYTVLPLDPPQIYLGQIPKGYRGTTRTVVHMQALIRGGAKDFYVRQKAIDILLEAGIKPKDYLGEIKTLFEWVQRNVRYTKDPYRVEVLHAPRRMLELRAGDCDDMTILLGSMLEAIGHPVRLVLAGPDPLRPRLFTHVYLEVNYKGRWIALDPTMPYSMGWAPRVFVKQVVTLDRRSNMMSQDMELEGMLGAVEAPDWLKGLVRSVRREPMQPKDVRVKSLWDLLRQRRLLSRSPWLRAVLRRIWDRGLAARPRPYTTRRMVRLLRRWGILPPASVRHPAQRPVALRPLRPVAVQPVRPPTGRTASPAARPVASTATRR